MSPRTPLIQPLFAPADPGLLLSAVRRFARNEELFQPGAQVLVAVSGGPDSVALLHALSALRPEWDLRLGVAHFDHGLRGEVSKEDARFVAELAQDLEVPFHAGEGDVRSLATAKKVSVQMAARQLRLDFLEKVRRDGAYDRLALGHTADDQVELFFLRLLRGAGTEGIKGMWPRTPGGLVRPLLAVGKDLVLAWLHHEKIPYREDVSNLSRRYLRNQVRLDLLPQLQHNYNPRIKAAVWRLMAFLQEDERLLADAADQAWNTVGRWVTPACAALSIPPLLALPSGLQARLLRRTLGRFLTHQEITSAQVDNLAALAQGKRSGGMITYEGCLAARAGQELHFFSPLPTPAGAPSHPAPGIGLIDSPDGWRLEARKLSGPLPATATRIPRPGLAQLRPGDLSPEPAAAAPRRPLPAGRGSGFQKNAGFSGGCQDPPLAAAPPAPGGERRYDYLGAGPAPGRLGETDTRDRQHPGDRPCPHQPRRRPGLGIAPGLCPPSPKPGMI